MSPSNLHKDTILLMIRRIEKSTKKNKFNFSDIDFYDTLLLRLQVIGEQIRKLPKNFINSHPEIKWKRFIKFRNIVSHDYFRIANNILKDVISKDIPKLKKAIKLLK